MSNSSFFTGSGITANQTSAIATSVTAAASSATSSASSATTSNAKAAIATTKANEAAASAAASEASKDASVVAKNAAASSLASASTQATNSANSASSAGSQANSSASSASTASGHASTATTKANEAAASAALANTKAGIATTAANSTSGSATAAASSASAANQSKINALAAELEAENAEAVALNASSIATSKAQVASEAAITATNKANQVTTNTNTSTTKANEAAASATAAASSATTSTASKNAAVAVTANFLGAHSSAPTQTAAGGSLAVGMLYFDTGSDVLKVRASGGWINAGSSINGTSARFAYTLTANQTTVTGNDAAGNSLQFDAPFCDVFLNGVKLAAADMNITSGTSVVLAAGATAGDILEVVAFGTFQLNNGTFAGTTTVNNLAVTGTATATTQAAGNDTTRLATTAFTQAAITALVGSVPATLNTLAELGDALGDDPNYATTTSNLIGTKMPKAGGTFTGDVSLGNNKKVIFGDGSDLKIYHSGSHSIIDNTSGGLFFNQWVDDADITFQNDNSTGGTTTYMLMQGSTGEVQLRHYGSTKISTKASGVEVAGNMVVSGTVDGVDIAARDAVLTSTTTTANAALPKAGGAFTGAVTTNSTFDGVDIATRDAVLTTTTNTANAALPKAGGALTGNLSTTGQIDINTGSNGAPVLKFTHTNSGADNFQLGAGTPGVSNGGFTIRDVDASANRLVINASGNIGIGTSAPSKQVSIFNNSQNWDAYSTLRLATENEGTYYVDISAHRGTISNADRGLAISVGASEKMRVLQTGRVGIGIKLPLGRLHIKDGASGMGSVNANFDKLVLEDSSHSGMTILGGANTHGAIYFGDPTSNDVGQIKYQHNDDTLRFTTAGSEGMALSSTGDLSTAGHNSSSGGAQFVGGTSIVRAAANFNLTTAAQMVVPRSSIMSLATGTYLMCIYLSGGNWYGSTVTGIVQHYGGTTNSNSSGGPNTIHLTASGHAQNSGSLFAKYQTTLGNNNAHGVMVWSSNAVTTQMTITFKRLK